MATKVEVKEEVTEIDTKKLNIFQKMSLATSKIERVIKGLTVGEGKNSYKAVSDKDVNNAVKPIEAELGIYSYPVARKISEETREEFTNKYGTTMNFVIKLETTYRFVNVDDKDDFIDITTYGYGIDSQDKAPGKAMTYADKYALLKAYKIETGEDPDKDKSEEYTPNKKSNNPSPYDFQDEFMTEEQTFIIASLDAETKEKIRKQFKKDPVKLTKKEAEQLMPMLKARGLIKTKEDVERERKEMEEVFE